MGFLANFGLENPGDLVALLFPQRLAAIVDSAGLAATTDSTDFGKYFGMWRTVD